MGKGGRAKVGLREVKVNSFPESKNSLDNEVINSQSLFSFKKILNIKLLSKFENQS